MQADRAGVRGHVCLELIRDGNVITRHEGKNLVVATGKNLLAHRLWKTTPRIIKYMQLGTGSTGATAADTGVATEIAATTSFAGRQEVVSMTMSGQTATWEHTWTASEFSANNVQEVGLFNSPTTGAGTMASRFVFTAVNKTKSDTLKITWKMAVS